jgi:hypothetical protein
LSGMGGQLNRNRGSINFGIYTHFFSKHDVCKMLEPHKFIDIHFRDDILPNEDIWSGDNVIFTITSK